MKLLKYIWKVFVPLRHGYGLSFLLYTAMTMLILTFISSIAITLTLNSDFGSLQERFVYSVIQGLSFMVFTDKIFFIVTSFLIALIFVNFFYYRCKKKTTLSTVLLGVLTTTCPACILPLFGLLGLASFMGTYNYFIKSTVLFTLFGMTVFIANQEKCKEGDDGKNTCR